MVASVPELTSRTCSSGRTRRTTSSTSETSPGCGAPKESPRPAASCTASTTCSFACPRIIGPQDPTRSTNSRPSASCSMAPEAEVMNGGVPPTLPKARTGEFTPEGRSEEHTSELQSRGHLVCRLLHEKKKSQNNKDK